MNQHEEWLDYPRFMVAVNRKFVTLPSPKDGQHGLAVFWTKSTAKKVARSKPGAVVIEATPEMFVEALVKRLDSAGWSLSAHPNTFSRKRRGAASPSSNRRSS